MRRSNIFNNINFVSVVLAALFLTQLIIFSLTITRGFDFSDEAFGYLALLHPEEITHAATYYGTLYDFLFGWMGVNVFTVRIIRLLLLLICCAVFALGLIRWRRRDNTGDKADEINLFLFILLGGFVIHASGTQSFTYNLFSTFLFLLIVGLFLYTFQGLKEVNRSESIIYFVIGALLFSLFAVKFSNAIFLGTLLLLLLVYDKRNLKTILLYALLVVCGGACMWFLFFGSKSIQWMSDYYQTLTTLNKNTGQSIWNRYLEDYINVKDNLLLGNLKWIVLSLLLLGSNHFVRNKTVNIVIAGAFAALLAYFTWRNTFYMGGTPYFYVFTLFYLFIVFILLVSYIFLIISDRFAQRSVVPGRILVVILLLAVPFLGSLGTNNLLTVQFIWYIPFLFALLFLLLQPHGRGVLNFVLVVLAINGSFQGVSGLVYYPYRIKATLFEQSHTVPPELDEPAIRLDKGLTESLKTVHDIVHTQSTYVAGGPIFSFRSEFGFVYFLKGTLPGWTWYRDDAPESNCISLRKSGLKNLDQTIFILPKNYAMDSVFNQCLKDININFENYTAIGETSYEFEGNARPLKIYAPNTLVRNVDFNKKHE